MQNTSTLPRKRSLRLGEEVMNDLVEKIRSGVYKTGDKLPTEPVIMAEQGVSRTVVREAISRLQAAGFAETRHGVGTFVLPLPPPPAALDRATVKTILDVLEMLELRISVETEAAALAAQRRSEENLVRMRQALDAFEEGIDTGERSVEADFQFHLQIALATGNKYFEDLHRHMGTMNIPRARLDTAQYSQETRQAYLQQVNHEHESILDAIARKDPESARAGMRLHLTNSRERLRRASEAADQQADAETGS